MDIYHERRLVSWIAFHCNNGLTLAQILSRAAARRPPFAAEDVRRLYPSACQAVQNATLIADAMRPVLVALKEDATAEQKAAAEAVRGTRVCDIIGCKWPNQGDAK